MQLHFSARVIRHPLPEPAYGLSRYELDRLLLQEAARACAEMVREHWSATDQGAAVILAASRKSIAASGNRLFGFKAHFIGTPVGCKRAAGVDRERVGTCVGSRGTDRSGSMRLLRKGLGFNV